MISCVRSFTVGLVIAEVTEPVGAGADNALEPMTGYPVLASAIAWGFDADEQFRLGLATLLDGFAAVPAADHRRLAVSHVAAPE
jgi:hypothetical protein